MMAQIGIHDEADSETEEKKSVFDPCCGSGRMLLAVADKNPHWDFIGQDIDLRCVKMTAINLALRNLYGYVIWGDSLRGETKLAYRTGLNIHGGVIRFARPGELSERFGSDDQPSPPVAVGAMTISSQPNDDGPAKQLHLF